MNMSEIVDRLLIVGGTGRNVGKSTLICKIIAENIIEEITAIKITPHFHIITDGLNEIGSGKGYRIFRELSKDSNKDTSRMLRAGAKEVILIQTSEESYLEAFRRSLELISHDGPIICESPSLRHLLVPEMFIMVKGDINAPGARSDSVKLLSLAGIVFDSEKLFSGSETGISYKKDNDRKWTYEPIK